MTTVNTKCPIQIPSIAMHEIELFISYQSKMKKDIIGHVMAHGI